MDSLRKATGDQALHVSARWGINVGDWLWSTRLKILFVVDAHINLSHGPLEFGLGQVFETIRNRTSAWWIRVDVDVATRDGSPNVHQFGDLFDLSSPWPFDAPLLPWPFGNRWKLYQGFRFTRPDFDLDTYDQVWFFGYHPGDLRDDDANIFDAQYSPLEDAELKIVAEWMDRGGGVFAAGDHGTLGASMCSRIPRVRTMRKWTYAQSVPAKVGVRRHETLVQVSGTNSEEKEGDRWPQTIEPVYQLIASSPFPFVNALNSRVPHPLLCSSVGVIDRFPDHMHEGEVFEDGAVDLRRPLDIPGYQGNEYPAVEPIVVAAGAVDFGEVGIVRPGPRVIAHGRTTNPEQSSVKRFPLISVYDGDTTGIGRVVVDSTWHHWFSMNLVGFQEDSSPTVFTKLQAYYRNVAIWLTTPAQRASMLFAATWGVLTGLSPMAFDRRMGPWEIGDRVMDVLRRTASPCIVSELVNSFLARDSHLSTVPAELPPGAPCWSCLPVEVVNRAIVGGIGFGLLDLALEYTEARGVGRRSHLDPDAIRKRGSEGAREGYRLLQAMVATAGSDIATLDARLADGFRPPATPTIPVSIEVASLHVVAERLQLPEATDPFLMGDQLTITVRARVEGEVVAVQTLERIPIPAFTRQGSVIDLDLRLEVFAHTGQRLTVEVLAGNWKREAATTEAVRFSQSFEGDPSDWVGSHAPSASHTWRLWYRIDPSPQKTHRAEP